MVHQAANHNPVCMPFLSAHVAGISTEVQVLVASTKGASPSWGTAANEISGGWPLCRQNLRTVFESDPRCLEIFARC